VGQVDPAGVKPLYFSDKGICGVGDCFSSIGRGRGLTPGNCQDDAGSGGDKG